MPYEWNLKMPHNRGKSQRIHIEKFTRCGMTEEEKKEWQSKFDNCIAVFDAQLDIMKELKTILDTKSKSKV